MEEIIPAYLFINFTPHLRALIVCRKHTQITRMKKKLPEPQTRLEGAFVTGWQGEQSQSPGKRDISLVRLPVPWCSGQGRAGSPLSSPNVHLDEWIHRKEKCFSLICSKSPGKQLHFNGYIPQKWFSKGCKVWPAVLSLIDDFIGYEGNQAPWSSALSWIWGSSRSLSPSCTGLLIWREGDWVLFGHHLLQYCRVVFTLVYCTLRAPGPWLIVPRIM